MPGVCTFTLSLLHLGMLLLLARQKARKACKYKVGRISPFLLQESLAYGPKDSPRTVHQKREIHTLYETHDKSDRLLCKGNSSGTNIP